MTDIFDQVSRLESEETCDDAYEVLMDLGEAALEPLGEAMLDEQRPNKTRELCGQLLGQIVPAGVRRLLSLVRTASDNDADLAAWGLRFNFAPDIADEALLEMLGDPSDRVRTNAARAVRYIHCDLRHCDRRLLTAAGDHQPHVRRDIIRTLVELADIGLAKYGLSEGEVLLLAYQSLDDHDPETREFAAELVDTIEN